MLAELWPLAQNRRKDNTLQPLQQRMMDILAIKCGKGVLYTNFVSQNTDLVMMM